MILIILSFIIHQNFCVVEKSAPIVYQFSTCENSVREDLFEGQFMKKAVFPEK